MSADFPKRCAVCGRTFDLWVWHTLRLKGHQVDAVETLEIRDCVCGNTMAVIAPDRSAPGHHLWHPEREGNERGFVEQWFCLRCGRKATRDLSLFWGPGQHHWQGTKEAGRCPAIPDKTRWEGR